MVEGCQFVVVGIAGLGIATVHILGQLQHIISVTSLWAVNVVDEVDAGLLAGEVLTARVTAKGEGTLTRHDVPEEICRLVIRLEVGRTTDLIPIVCQPAVLHGIQVSQFADALEAHDLGYLRIGVHIVETILTLRHGRE